MEVETHLFVADGDIQKARDTDGPFHVRMGTESARVFLAACKEDPQKEGFYHFLGWIANRAVGGCYSCVNPGRLMNGVGVLRYLPEPPKGDWIFRACGWCWRFLGYKEADRKNHGRVSHGICDDCLERTQGGSHEHDA